MIDLITYEPTEAETEAIDRAGMVAAWRVLKPLVDMELPSSAAVLICLKAFKAADSATEEGKAALLAAHPEANYACYHADVTALVCNAMYGLDDANVDDIHPMSMVGARISALFQAAKALEAMSTVYSAFDDDDEVFGTYLADETTAICEDILKAEGGRK